MERGLSKKSESQRDCDLCDASAHHHPHCFCQPHLLACRQRSTRSHLDLIALTARPTSSNVSPPLLLLYKTNLRPTTKFNHRHHRPCSHSHCLINIAHRRIRQTNHAHLFTFIGSRILDNASLATFFSFLYSYSRYTSLDSWHMVCSACDPVEYVTTEPASAEGFVGLVYAAGPRIFLKLALCQGCDRS